MRLKSLLTAIVGVGVAGGAVYVAQALLQPEQRLEAQPSLVRVIVAAQDIPYGAAIESGMLTTIDWPAAVVPAGVFTQYAQVVPDAGGQPRRAKYPLAQGEILISSKLSDFGDKVTIVQTLGQNNRAMAINVNAQSGVGGFVTPGDFVDIVLTQGRNASLQTVTILQNIRVIGVDQKADEQIDQPGVARTVTVEVTPEQGQRLALAQQAGQLSLSLRALDTTEDKPLAAIRLEDILFEAPASAEEEAPPVKRVRVRRGANSVEEVQIN